MNDHRVRPGGGIASDGRRADDALAADLRALSSEALRDLPNIEDTRRALERSRPPRTRGGTMMAIFGFLRTRSVVATMVGGAAVALVLLAVPVSYTRTLGQVATLTLGAPEIDEALAGRIAMEWKAALGADGVRVSRERVGGDIGATTTTCRLEGRVRSRSRRAVERVAAAFTRALGERGLDADVSVTPWTERVSANVYAMASDRVTRLRIDWSTGDAAGIEASIRQQLEAAGISNPTVDVSVDGNQKTVRIQAGDDRSDGRQERMELEIHTNGEGGAGGADSTAVLMLPKYTGTPDQVRAQIEEALRREGVTDANVNVTGDSGRMEVRVERRKEQ